MVCMYAGPRIFSSPGVLLRFRTIPAMVLLQIEMRIERTDPFGTSGMVPHLLFSGPDGEN